MSEIYEVDDEPVEVVETFRAKISDDGPKAYYGPDAILLLMSDGSVRWEWADA